MRRILVLAVPLIVLVLLAAGCGGGGGGGGTTSSTAGAPSVGTLLSGVATASKTQHSAHYVADLTVSAEGSSSNPQLQLLASKPIKLRVDGDASSTAFTANGSVSALGKEYSAKALLGSNALYINLLGNWYGSQTVGLQKLKQLGTTRASTTPGTQQFQNLQKLQQNAGQILTGSVTGGPTLDGVSTWEYKGTLNADGLAKLSQQQGQTLTSQQQNALKAVASGMSFTVDVGQDDHLIRNLGLKLDLTADQLSSLNQGSTSSSLNGLSALHFSFTLGLSKWGESVSFTPPSSYQPLSAISQAFAGLIQQSQTG